MLRQNKIDSLQGLRGIAALFVILFHLGKPTYLTSHSYFRYISSFGFSGVDLFFVLSGFIIYYTSTQNTSLTAHEFFLKRFIRIYPIYWIATLPVLAAYILFLAFPSLAASHSGLYHEISSGGANFLIISLALLPFSTHSLVSVAWTLSYEVSFYIIFGLIYFWNKRMLLVGLAAWAGISVIATFLLHVDLTTIANYSLMQLTDPIIIEFIFGCVAAMIYIRNTSRYTLTALTLGILLFSTAALTGTAEDSHRVLNYGLPAALIIFALASSRKKVPGIFVYLGDASYSIYIFHVPLLSAIAKCSFFFSRDNLFINTVTTGAIFAVIVLACSLIHSYIEKPLLDHCKKWLIRDKELTSEPLSANHSA